MKEKTIAALNCLRCQYYWLPRNLRRPVQCPRCRRLDWDSKKVKERAKNNVDPKYMGKTNWLTE